MAKYEIINPVICVDRYGKEYLKVKLRNTETVYENPFVYVIHDSQIIQLVADYIKSGKELPDEIRYVYGKWCDVEFPPFYKRYYGRHPKSGELIRDMSGKPVVYNSLCVFCLGYIDSTTKEFVYTNGNYPTKVAYEAYCRFCTPTEDNKLVVIVANEDLIIPAADETSAEIIQEAFIKKFPGRAVYVASVKSVRTI